MEYKNEEERRKGILYNLQCTKDTLKEAEVLAKNQLWRGCANRLYYAAFYVVNALLIKNDYYSKTHAGTRNLLNQHFIKTSIIQESMGTFYTQLFDKRQEGDYGNSVSNTKENVLPMIEPTKEFIETVKKLIEIK